MTGTPAGRLDRVLPSCGDVEALGRAVFAAVAADVPFDFACLATTDPASGLITGAVKSRPLPVGDEDFAGAEYGGPDVNQLVDVARRPVPVAVLSLDTDGDVAACRRMREFMTPVLGFTDELRLACRSRETMWGALALYRGPGEPPFTRRDADLLGEVHGLVADHLRRVLFAVAPGAPDPGGAAVLVVDAGNRVTDMSAAAQARIDELGGWDNGSLPSTVLAVAALARSSGAPAATRVPARSGRWLALRALTLDGATGRSVVVTVEEAPAAAIGQMALEARGLTAREQDVARLVLQGASTRDIAATLFLSPHTVQDHLKSIFGKLGVGSRREMIARLVLPG